MNEINEEEIQLLIDKYGENDFLDFKSENYSKDNKEELVKDLIAFANSHSEHDKYILIGIKEKNNLFDGFVDFDCSGIDEAKFQQLVSSNVKDDLKVFYKLIYINKHKVLVIKIPMLNNRNRPFMVKKQIGKLKENEMFIRKGSTTILANKNDLKLMLSEVKKSDLHLKCYDKTIEKNICCKEINEILADYEVNLYNNLIELSKKIVSLKSSTFDFSTSGFLVKEEKIELDLSKKNAVIKWLEYERIEYDDEIFDFSNIRLKTCFGKGMMGIYTELYGDKNEKERYDLLLKLSDYIIEYIVIKEYVEQLPKMYSLTLLLSNDGSFPDENVELKLKIKKNNYINYQTLFKDFIDKSYLGNMFYNLKEKIFECPKLSNIGEYPQSPPFKPNISNIKIPYGLYNNYEPSYFDKLADKMTDVDYYLKDLFDCEQYEENDEIVLKFYFNKIMHNTNLFLSSNILLNTNSLSIEYEIRSKANTEVLYGKINSNS